MLGLQQSLTPSRNNGFLNMFLKIQKTTLEMYMEREANQDHQGAPEGVPMSQKIEDKLNATLKPTRYTIPFLILIQTILILSSCRLEILDDSASHAGHRPDSASGGTHFRVEIVSDSFEGVNTVKRHKQVYGALAQYMEPNGSIHALSLSTKAPSEV